MKTILFKVQVFGLLLISLLAGGCSQVASIVVSRSVTVIAAQDICKKSVEVHLVGVNRYEKDTWEAISMTDYWRPDNQLRQSAKAYTHVMQFGQGPCEKVLDRKHPIQRVWKKRKAEYLFVLADLPGIFPDLPGNADARRLRLPALNSSCWYWDQKDIKVSLEGSNVVPLTIPDPKCD